MKALLFAAGLGTRLKPFTDHHPKAMALVGGKTLLEHNIRYLQKNGIYDVVVNVHHFGEQIIDLLEKERGFGSHVAISDERDRVLETGGGLKKAAHFFAGMPHLAAMNADILTTLNMRALIDRHIESGNMATLAVSDRFSARRFLFDEHQTLCGWQNTATGEVRLAREAASLLPLAFSGIQVLSARIFEDVPLADKFSLVDWYLHLAKTKRIAAYDHSGDLFLDIGKPENLSLAQTLFGDSAQ
jgi:NDP-sugar pyrophosphorylase family protein